ncbi:MAG: dTDP-4-dehydrorhamnose reductase [Mariprofundus sp.]|nr:dTDP-4-dehydrorhamnose reductase [Mariprofundus sp.]
MMRLLITGCDGQVGTELTRQSRALGWTVKAVDRDGLDIVDPDAVNKAVRALMPDVVINAAAYTAVDKAEHARVTAFAVNRDGPMNLAAACADLDIPLIHYSTDYVFDGSKSDAYVESDPVAPLGVYGESKLAGEQAVGEFCSKHLILRTSWVFSSHGNNFVKTMLRLAAEREELGVVADQLGKPSSAAEIARLTLQILPGVEKYSGIYHLAQPDVTSWFCFAEAIFEEARRHTMVLKLEDLNAIATSDYPTPARRPANSELSCDKLESTFSVRIRPWRESLSEVIGKMKDGSVE